MNNNLPNHSISSVFLDQNVCTNLNNGNSQFSFALPRTIMTTSSSKMSLSKFSVPYSWFNITRNIGNNVLYLTWNDGYNSGGVDRNSKQYIYEIVIPDGFYSIIEINSLLQNFMIEKGLYLINASGNNVYYFEIVYNIQRYRIQFNSYPLPTSLPVGWSIPTTGTQNVVLTGGPYKIPQLIVPSNVNQGPVNMFTYFGLSTFSALPVLPITMQYTMYFRNDVNYSDGVFLLSGTNGTTPSTITNPISMVSTKKLAAFSSKMDVFVLGVGPIDLSFRATFDGVGTNPLCSVTMDIVSSSGVIKNIGNYSYTLLSGTNNYTQSITIPDQFPAPGSIFTFTFYLSGVTNANGFSIITNNGATPFKILITGYLARYPWLVDYNNSSVLPTNVLLTRVTQLPVNTVPIVAQSTLANYAPRQSNVHSICLTCDLIDNPIRSTTIHPVSSFVLSTQTVSVSFGNNIPGNDYFTIWIPLLANQTINTLNFSLTDQDGNLLILEDPDTNIEVLLSDIKY